MKSNTFKQPRFIDATNDVTEVDKCHRLYNEMLNAAIHEEETNGVTLDELGDKNPEMGCFSIIVAFAMIGLFFAFTAIMLTKFM